MLWLVEISFLIFYLPVTKIEKDFYSLYDTILIFTEFGKKLFKTNYVVSVSGVKVLLQAYKSLQQAFNEAKTTEGAETCGSDLYVQCAEIAYKVIYVKMVWFENIFRLAIFCFTWLLSLKLLKTQS